MLWNIKIVWVKKLSISPLNTLISGVISGVIGIFSWINIIKAANYQPPIDSSGCDIQLFFTHIFCKKKTSIIEIF